jgi:hypothetical protein
MTYTMTYKQGDVVIINFPYTSGKTLGHFENKDLKSFIKIIRPIIILDEDIKN